MTVYQKQCLLAFLGYDTGGVDGIWGEKSAQAVRQFQADFGLTQDGSFGSATEEAIRAAVASGKTAPARSPGNFWKEIPNFTRSEFRCRCGKYCDGFPAEPAEKLVRAAQALREQVGAAVILSSGVRCPAHNAEVGGVPNSRHLTGHAMDFTVQGMTSAQALPLAKALSGIVYAYAIDDQYVHMDIGG